MNVFSPLDLIKAHPWSQALFTTYSLSLSFFESVILDALIRQQVANSLILSDIDGIRASLSEYGARSAGRLYDIEPVAVDSGCFHPKLIVLASQTQAHIVVSSGNLTFGGWGSNFECLDHIHSGFAADAVEDVAEFLETLDYTARVKLAAGKACSRIAKQLRTVAATGVRTGRVRVIHNLERSLFDQFGEIADDLGGARRLTIVSPFYDGAAANELRKRLNLTEASLHVHEGGTVAGSTDLSWPTIHREHMVPVKADWCYEEPPRQLHAKVFEVICGNGRIVASGSANATTAALGVNRNVELCVVRVDRATTAKWRLTPAARPTPVRHTAEDAFEQDRTEGILRATITSGQLTGSVMTPFPTGEVRVFRVNAAGEVLVGSTSIDGSGSFSFTAGNLEMQAWSNERFLLRVVAASGDSASGFVMFTDLSDIRNRVGGASGSFFAFLAGTETPDDVAAIMDWFHEHPSAFVVKNPFASFGSEKSGPSEATVGVAGLLGFSGTGSGDAPIAAAGAPVPAWHHFMQSVLHCFQEFRGPLTAQGEASPNRGADEDTAERSGTSVLPNEEKEKPLRAFSRLFATMLPATAPNVDVGLAFRITQYVCERVEPDAALVFDYLKRLVAAFAQHQPRDSDREIAAAAALLRATRLNVQSEMLLARAVRADLLRVGADLNGGAPDMTLVRGFVRLLAIDKDFGAMWTAVRRVRTPQEEVRAYHSDTRHELADTDYPFLSSMPEWNLLKNGNRRGIHIMSRYSDVCPFCFNRLPTASASRLQTNAITSHCGKVLLCEELSW
jgi:hypothetical protein